MSAVFSCTGYPCTFRARTRESLEHALKGLWEREIKLLGRCSVSVAHRGHVVLLHDAKSRNRLYDVVFISHYPRRVKYTTVVYIHDVYGLARARGRPARRARAAERGNAGTPEGIPASVAYPRIPPPKSVESDRGHSRTTKGRHHVPTCCYTRGDSRRRTVSRTLRVDGSTPNIAQAPPSITVSPSTSTLNSAYRPRTISTSVLSSRRIRAATRTACSPEIQ